MKILVVVPTYNERDNISALLPQLKQQAPQVDILVVDDNSPDGTAEAVRGREGEGIFLLSRPQKQGLGRAYVAGFAWGLSHSYDVLVEMDADFSHRPVDVLTVLDALTTGTDFVVGSRHCSGGTTVNWGLVRTLISRGGNQYARTLLGYPLGDWTGGLNAWRRHVLEKIGLGNITSEGYSFQVELKYRALQLGFKGVEVPIVFEDRRVGQSKMSWKIVAEAVVHVWRLRAAKT